LTAHGVRRGRLQDPSGAPAVGERFLELASFPTATIEQILSGRLAEPAAFEQPHDEWVVLLAGGAKMLVDGEELELEAGDWLLIPAGCPHTVLETQPGSSWLALHLTGRD
jgi:mannose-6-phosphate isomerase-like protein (cupin superfamily)